MQRIVESLSVILAISSLSITFGFVIQQPSRSIQKFTTSSSITRRLPTHLYRDRYDKELVENAERKARQTADGSGGGAVAGVFIGGLLGGPFGALFGASIGSSIGASKAIDKAKKEELERLGVTNDMLESAKEIGLLLERATEGLRATEDSLITQQKFAKRLEMDANKIYDDAKEALAVGNEDAARDLLLKKNQMQDKLKKTLMNCVEEKQRLSKMQENVSSIEERAFEIESVLKRTIGAKAMLDTSSDFSLANEDPLLQKFKDAGLD